MDRGLHETEEFVIKYKPCRMSSKVECLGLPETVLYLTLCRSSTLYHRASRYHNERVGLDHVCMYQRVGADWTADLDRRLRFVLEYGFAGPSYQDEDSQVLRRRITLAIVNICSEPIGGFYFIFISRMAP